MKKILKTLLYLALFGAVSLGLLTFFPGLRYYINDTKLQWIGQELAKGPALYDYAFIGSSHIWNALDAPLIGRELGGSAQRAVNLGINWGGRDVHCLIARDFLNHHKVKNLVIEVWRYEHPRSHDYFPFLSLPKDVLRHAQARRLLGKEVWNLEGDFKAPVNFILSQLAASGIKGYRRLWDRLTFDQAHARERMKANDQLRGFYPVPGNPQAVAEFQAKEEDYTSPPMPAEWDPEAVEGGKENSIWHIELSGLARLCREKGTRLIFLFLPYRANQRPSPKYVNYLKTMGVVYDLPREIMVHKKYWRDRGHLTPEGSEKLSRYFIQREREAAGKGS